MRIYEWAKIIYNVAKEKVSLFTKGFIGGTVLLGNFLFNHITLDSIFGIEYVVKLLAALVGGLISGFATVGGNDLYHWAKHKITKKRTRIQQKKRTKKAA